MRYVLCALLLCAIPVFAQETPTLKVGDPAPAIELPATLADTVAKGKKTIALADLKGKKNVVLFFFPRAMTKGCTIQCKGFTKLKEDFDKADTVAIGISTDPLSAQEKFMAKDSLGIPLLADNDFTASRAFGVIKGKSKAASRITFIIDKKGIVRQIVNPASPATDPTDALKFVQEKLK
jgi:thioredoxin-dependent peroxiredoxin